MDKKLLKDLYPDKVIVGLTGTFGTGKSTVSRFLEEMGAYIVHADDIAHEVLFDAGLPEFRRVRALFEGEDVTGADGLDRKKIAAIVFQDGERRKKLEAIVHPYVFRKIFEDLADVREKVVILDVPLLFETEFDQHCHKVLVVNAPAAAIEKRLAAKGYSSVDLEARNKAQWPIEQKMKKADFVINNSGNFEETRQEAEKIWKDLRPVLKGDK